MATGPSHYQQAEDFLGNARDKGFGSDEERYYLAAAQVHATLALAAAMGTFGVAEETRTADDANAWERVAGEYTAQRGRRAARDEAERLEAEAEQAAKDAEAADDAMSATERFEHDQADEAKLDAAGWGQGGAPF